MANKKLLYNENGTNAEIANSGSLPAVYFDDTTNTLVAQGLVINKVTASIGSTNGILGTDANGKLTTISTASATSGQYLQSDGTNWAFRNATGVATGDYLPGSDLSGSLSAPTVISIRNVVSGTLSASYGGTGVTSFTSGGLLVKDNTNTLKFIKPDAGASVLRPDGSGSWYSGGATGTASYNIQTQYFTCSTPGVTYTTTWTKPPNIRNLRVILQGGGGGGGGGCKSGPNNSDAGAGGGAGGLSLYELNNLDATQTFNVSINVGAGGAGGTSSLNPAPTSTAQSGSTGGTSYASSSFFYYYADGGTGGREGGDVANLGTGGEPGWGNLTALRGGYGRDKNSNNAVNPIPSVVGSGGGGSFRNPGDALAADGGDSLLLNSYVAAKGAFGTGNTTPTAQPGSPGGSASIALSIPPYTLYVGGGGGGGAKSPASSFTGSSGGNGVYGSGGGGASALGVGAASTNAKGGNGGDGYVLIAYW
jgi:hypothetical protein